MRRVFFAGLAVLLPLALTVWFTGFILDLLTKPFIAYAVYLFQTYDFLPISWIEAIPNALLLRGGQVIIVVLLVFSTIALGALARWLFVKSMINRFDRIIQRIPMINRIYRSTKEAVNTLLAPEGNAFKEAVMVPFPHNGGRSIGFLSSKHPETDSSGEIAVFVPTVPNPMMGLLVRYKPEEIVHLDLSVEEAFKTLVSCGLSCPGIRERSPAESQLEEGPQDAAGDASGS